MRTKNLLIGVLVGLLICSLIPSGSAISIRDIYAEEVWKYNAGAEIQSEIIADSNGVIYFGTGWGVPVANDKIIALYPNGTLKWEFNETWGFWHITGLALSNDESVVYAADGGSDVYAIYTANGTKKWGHGINHGDSERPGLCGIVVDANDNIYIGSWCCAEGLYSLNYTGGFRWDLGGDECHSGHAIGKSNTVIYYLDVDFGLREVQLSNGNINWVHKGYSWGCWGTGIEIADDGTIYYQDSEYFYAMNPDGSEKWFFALQDLAYPGAPYGISQTTAIAISSDGNIWFGAWHDYEYRVMCLDSSGNEEWSYVLPDWIGSGFAGMGLALDSYDIVYVGCHDNNLYAIDPTGYLRWNFTAGGEIGSGILLSNDENTIYFGSDDGYLYAITEICTFELLHGIYGWVYDTSTYNILKDTNIACSNTSWSDSTTSNSEGYYEFNNLLSGNYWINASQFGYIDNGALVEVVEGYNETLLSNGDAL